MSGVGWRVWRRRLAVDRLLVGALAVSVTSAAAGLAAVPRVYEHAAAHDIRHTVGTAEPERRNIAMSLRTRIPADSGDEPGAVRARGAALLDAMPDAVASVVAMTGFVVDSPPFRVTSYPDGRAGPFTMSLRLRLQDGIDAESAVVAGRRPAPHDPIVELIGDDCPESADLPASSSGSADCERVETPVIETLLTRQTATDLEVAVGDMVTLTPDQTDLRWQRSGAGDHRAVLLVVGFVELSDVDREYWYADNRLHGARITENADFRTVDATGLVVAEQYRALLRDVPLVDFDHTWRLHVDPTRFDVEIADDVAIALANVELDPVVVHTDLPDLVDEFRRQRTIVQVVLSTVVVGFTVVVAASVGALARLLSLRRAAATSLVVARGAGRLHLVLDSLRTAAVIVVPSAALGWLAARAVFPSTTSSASTRLLVLLAVAVVVTMVVALRARPGGSGESARRLVVDVTVIVTAAAAVASLRRRGDVSVDGVAELDPLLAIAPSLVAVAVALALMRAIAPLGRLLARVGRPLSGAVVFVGFRQLVARPAAARTATGVIVVAVAVAVFAAALHASISTARNATSWYVVGGEYTVGAFQPGAPLPAPLAAIDRPGTARRAMVERATVRYGRNTATVDVVAVDAARYAAVLADAPIDHPPLAQLADHGAAALVSTPWPRGRPPDVGDELRVDLGGGEQGFTVIASADSFPAVRAGRPFVVVDLEAASGARPTAVHLADDGDVVDDVADDLDPTATRLERRRDVVRTLAADPLSSWTVRILLGVTGAAGMFAAVSAATAVAASVRARERDLAVLRTLGLDAGQGSALTTVEHVPVLFVATVGGFASGVAAAWLLRAALGLARLGGSGRPVAIRVDAAATLAAAGLVVLAMTVAVASSIRVVRRRDLAATLRVGATT